MTVERCLTGSIKTWRSKYFNSKKATIVSLMVCAILLIMIIPFITLIDYKNSNGDVLNNSCLEDHFYLLLLDVSGARFKIVQINVFFI